ncbi:hypothetical protein RSOLAG1IB_11382 [Rhizoctonia solani AG-1 IB]|uniref:DUF4939 domain-containing protein n=1 Tax=Thanatephorus cucumeris (strain AG1-IB / isolate 7/3/14) TaxID=1108050 RepID=A0A0B7F7A9_THACB|nr:hypothetical protein RSOLAG1IB_11382 [Rhizoctonia solani AG-1 IB]
MVKETNQAVTREPATPEKATAGKDVQQTPRPFSLFDNPSSSLAAAATINPAGTTQWALPSFALPSNPIKPPPSSHLPASSQHTSHSPSPIRALTAPTLGALTKVKVRAPEPYKGGIGANAKQWLARMMGWLTISRLQFANNKDVIMFLLINMEGTAAAWALPHIALIGEKRAVIKTLDNFQGSSERLLTTQTPPLLPSARLPSWSKPPQPQPTLRNSGPSSLKLTGTKTHSGPNTSKA